MDIYTTNKIPNEQYVMHKNEVVNTQNNLEDTIMEIPNTITIGHNKNNTYIMNKCDT